MNKTTNRVKNKKQKVNSQYARILKLATAVFEDKQKAISWLSRPQVGLGDKVPLEMIETEDGAREVENLLGRIEHGVL